jgi:hypothetical protein
LEKSLQPHSVFGTATAINCLGFYFMQQEYTTQTTVDKKHCIIEVYKDHELWLTYDFHLNLLFYDSFGINIYNQLSYKCWGTTQNIAEIHNAIMKHLLSK